MIRFEFIVDFKASADAEIAKTTVVQYVPEDKIISLLHIESANLVYAFIDNLPERIVMHDVTIEQFEKAKAEMSEKKEFKVG